MGTKVEYKTISKTTKDFSILFENRWKKLKITVHMVGLSTPGGPRAALHLYYCILTVYLRAW